MAKKSLTTDDLIVNIKRKAFIPLDDDSYTKEDLLEMMDNEMDIFLVPHLLAQYEEYLVYSEIVELETGVSAYELPYRAVGNKLRDVFYVENPDAPEPQQIIREMHRIDSSEIYDYRSGNAYDIWNTGGLTYYVKNNKIVLLNEYPTANGALRMDYYMQPSSLVLTNTTGKISAIDRINGIITLSNFPTEFTNLPTDNCDFVKFRSPHTIVACDVDITSVSSTAKTLTLPVASIPDDLIVGDYVCFPQETPYPNVPSEMHSILAQLVAISILEGLDDERAKQSAERQLSRMKTAIATIINDRVDGSNKKIVNRHAPLGQGSIRRRR